jgi:hypothetical protein
MPGASALGYVKQLYMEKQNGSKNVSEEKFQGGESSFSGGERKEVA